MNDMNLVDQNVEIQDQKPPLKELILYLVVGFGLYILASIPLMFIVGNDLSDISIWVTVVIGILNAACLIGTVYLTGILRGKISWAGLGFIPPSLKIEWILLAVLVSIILLPVRSFLGAAVEWIVKGSLDSLQMRSDLLFAGAEPNFWNFLVSLLIIGVLVPISEELYFRGLLFNWFQLRFRLWPAVIFSSIIFGLAHYDSLAVIISSFVLGVVNAFAMQRTKSIWVPIIMHAITNGTAVIIMYAYLVYEQYIGPLT